MSEKSVTNVCTRGGRRNWTKALLAGCMLVSAAGPWAGGVSWADTSSMIKPSGPAQRIPDFVELVKQVKPAVVSITSMIRSDTMEGEGGGMGGGPFPFPFPFQMMPQPPSS